MQGQVSEQELNFIYDADYLLRLRTFINSSETILCCRRCGVHLANPKNLISNQFQGQTGKASLYSRVINVIRGPVVHREMTTGEHLIMDIYCIKCVYSGFGQKTIGWYYLKAFEQEQVYKEGKFILEKSMIIQRTNQFYEKETKKEKV